MNNSNTINDELRNSSDPYILNIDIRPRPASRPRFSSRGQVYCDPSYRDWLSDFGEIVIREWPHQALDHISHIEIIFNGPTKRGDLDNYLKACLDGLVYARVLKNDNLSVLDSIQTSFIHHKESKPWIFVKIFP